MKIKINLNIIIYLLLLSCCLGHANNMGYISLISALIIVLITFFCKLEKVFEILFISLPFFYVMNLNVGQTSLYYLLVIIFILKYIFNKKCFHIKKKLLLIVLILLITIPNVINAQSTYFAWLLLLIPLILSYKEIFLEKQFTNIIYKYALSMVLSSFVALYMQINNIYVYRSAYVWNDGNIVTRFSGLLGDSNIYSQSLLIIIALLIFNIFYNKNANHKITFAYITLLVFFFFFSYYFILLLFF